MSKIHLLIITFTYVLGKVSELFGGTPKLLRLDLKQIYHLCLKLRKFFSLFYFCYNIMSKIQQSTAPNLHETQLGFLKLEGEAVGSLSAGQCS